jgi:putative phosphoesterase
MAAFPDNPPDPVPATGLPSGQRSIRVGLIADTHGLLRPEAWAFLRGSDCIVHAGDICGPGILDELARIAPVTAVKGNCDQGPWAGRLRETESLRVGGHLLYVIHDLARLEVDPGALGIRMIVSGHSHIPMVKEHNGVLFINPGSAGPRRFRLPVSVGELVISGSQVSGRTEEIAVRS